MRIAGDETKSARIRIYLTYDTNINKLYILGLAINGAKILAIPGEIWGAINVVKNKVFDNVNKGQFLYYNPYTENGINYAEGFL